MNTVEIQESTLVRYFPRHTMTVTDGSPSVRTRRETKAIGGTIDDDLATRIAFGDVDAAVEMSERHRNHLVRIAEQIVGDEIEAEQLAEASLEDAFRGWPPERGQVRAWLTSLVRRRSKARVRALRGSSHA